MKNLFWCLPILFTVFANPLFLAEITKEPFSELKNGNIRKAWESLKLELRLKFSGYLIVGQVLMLLAGICYVVYIQYVELVDITLWGLIMYGLPAMGVAHIINVMGCENESFNNEQQMTSFLGGLFALVVWIIIYIISSCVPAPIDNVQMDISKDIKKPEISVRDISQNNGSKLSFAAIELSSDIEFRDISGKQYFIVQLKNKDSMNNVPGYIPGYIRVKTQSHELEFCEYKIHYAPSFSWGQNLKRHVHQAYPSYILFKESFQPDDSGFPYYFVTYGHYKTLRGGEIVDGAIKVNSVTGEMEDYKNDEIPDFVDNLKVK